MKYTVILFLMSITVLMPLNAGSAKEDSFGSAAEIPDDIQPGNILELTGRIRVKGNEPFVFTVLETAGGRDYKLSGEGVENLRAGFELKMVTLTGRVLSAGDESQLPVIEVLSFQADDGA